MTALALGCLAGACSDDGPEAGSAGNSSSVTLRDSAGITIVENHDSTWTAETRWSIAAEPELVIGSVDGSVPGTDWGRIADVLHLGRRVVVRGVVASEIRVFGPDGSFERAFGGEGQGPTEFDIITRVDAAGDDRVAVAEGNTGKVVVFHLTDPSASEVWSIGHPTMDNHHPGTIGGLATDGDYLLRFRPRIDRLPDGSFEVMRSAWQRVDRSGTLVRELPDLPSIRAYNKPGEGLIGWVQPTPQARFATRGETLWHAFPERWELTRVDLLTGSVDRVVRRDFDLAPTPEYLLTQMREAQDEQARAAPPDFRGAIRREAEAMEYSPFRPAFRTFLIDPEGHLWVNEELDLSSRPEMTYSEIYRTPSRHWTLLDPKGRWLGTVSVPEGLEVKEVGTDFVLGVRTDDLDVPFVERYRILKPQ